MYFIKSVRNVNLYLKMKENIGIKLKIIRNVNFYL